MYPSRAFVLNAAEATFLGSDAGDSSIGFYLFLECGLSAATNATGDFINARSRVGPLTMVVQTTVSDGLSFNSFVIRRGGILWKTKHALRPMTILASLSSSNALFLGFYGLFLSPELSAIQVIMNCWRKNER